MVKRNVQMRQIAIVGLTLLLISFDTPKLVRTKVAEGITMLVPKTWRPMDELDFSQRFPSVRAPLAGFTDEDRLCDVSVNISATQWPDENTEIAGQFFRAAIFNTFDRVDMIDEGIREVKGKKMIYFEFESTVKGNPRELGQQASIMNYNYLQYYLGPERTLVFSFHCPRSQRQDWQEAAGKIMENVRIK
jgi:hypothetical protein